MAQQIQFGLDPGISGVNKRHDHQRPENRLPVFEHVLQHVVSGLYRLGMQHRQEKIDGSGGVTP